MEQRRQRRHRAHKRTLAACRVHRRFFARTPGGWLEALQRAVAAQSSQWTAQERYRAEQRAAADRGRKARRALYIGLRHLAHVSRVVSRRNSDAQQLEPPAWTSDASLLAKAETMIDIASAHEDLYVQTGVRRGFLAVLAGEVAALTKAKDEVTRARARFTRSTAAFDRAVVQAGKVIAVLDGILLTSADAPVGARTSLRQAMRIGTGSARR